MRVHYVHAHGEPGDFGLVLVEAGVEALRAAGHVVEVSDVFGWAVAEKHCAGAREPAGSDVLRERRLIAACDVLVLQFPVWWLGLPAGLRHWIDRFLGGADAARRAPAPGMAPRLKRGLCVALGGRGRHDAAHAPFAPVDAVVGPIHRALLRAPGFGSVSTVVLPQRAASVAEGEAVLADHRERLVRLCAADVNA